MRKHQRVWNLIQQRKALSIVGSFSIIALLGTSVFLRHAQDMHLERVQALSQSTCLSCVSYQLPENTDIQDQEPFRFIPRHTAQAKVVPTHVVPVTGSSPVHSAPVTNTPSAPVSTPTKSAPAPLPTRGSVNVFPYGSCTWWANQRYFQLHVVFVPWRTQSNAWQWTARAYQFGWHVSGSPVVGAIIDLQPGVQGASSWGGHVAVVERILSNGHVIASNMNWGAYPWQVTYVEFAPGPGVTFIYR